MPTSAANRKPSRPKRRKLGRFDGEFLDAVPPRPRKRLRTYAKPAPKPEPPGPEPRLSHFDEAAVESRVNAALAEIERSQKAAP